MAPYINVLPIEVFEMIFLLCVMGDCDQRAISLVCTSWRKLLSQVKRLKYQRCITQGELYSGETPAPPLNLTLEDKVKLILWDNMSPKYQVNLRNYYNQSQWIAYNGMSEVILDARVSLFLHNMDTKEMEQVSPIKSFFYFVGLILSGEDIVISPKVIEHFVTLLGPRWNPIYLYKSVSESVYGNLPKKRLDLLWERESILELFPDCFPFHDDAIDLYCHGCCLLECECPCPSGQHIGMNCRCTCTYCKLPRQFQRNPRYQHLCQCINDCRKCFKPLQGLFGEDPEDLCECNDDGFSNKHIYLSQPLASFVHTPKTTYSPWNNTNRGNNRFDGVYRNRDEWLDAYEKWRDALEKLVEENGVKPEILGNHLDRLESWACQGVAGVAS